MSSSDRSDVYLWFDTEYTTLDLAQAALLQVALVVTDQYFTPLVDDGGLSLYVALPPDHEVAEWVRINQAEVLDRSRREGLPVAEVDERLARYVDDAVGPPLPEEKRRPILAGNSIHSDWTLVRRLLPEFARRLHYRLLDVTAFKVGWAQPMGIDPPDKDNPATVAHFFPSAKLRDGASRHDAYYDAVASIAELAYYRSKMR